MATDAKPAQQQRPALVALDLDGTLLRSDGSISTRTRRALADVEAGGIAIVSVTARPPRRVRQIARTVGLRGLAICSNGGVLYDVTADAVLRQVTLSETIAAAIVAGLRRDLPGVSFAIEAGLLYGCEASYVVQPEHARDAVDPEMLRDDALTLCRLGVTKLIVQHPEHPLDHLLRVTRGHAGTLASARRAWACWR